MEMRAQVQIFAENTTQKLNYFKGVKSMNKYLTYIYKIKKSNKLKLM